MAEFYLFLRDFCILVRYGFLETCDLRCQLVCLPLLEGNLLIDCPSVFLDRLLKAGNFRAHHFQSALLVLTTPIQFASRSDVFSQGSFLGLMHLLQPRDVSFQLHYPGLQRFLFAFLTVDQLVEAAGRVGMQGLDRAFCKTVESSGIIEGKRLT